MTGLVLLGALALGWWAWKTRDAQALRIGDVAAGVAALVALRLLTRGQELPGLVGLAGAGWWVWFRRGRGAGARARMTADQAARLLDIPADASAETIRAAHRRLVARVHPDAGGSADLAAQVNAARDTLLRRRS